jgi:outer membrane lipoprotein-sorting protein
MMRSILFLILGLCGFVLLSACGDKDQRPSSPSGVRKYADSYKDKAHSVEEELGRSSEAQRKTLEESVGESSK